MGFDVGKGTEAGMVRSRTGRERVSAGWIRVLFEEWSLHVALLMTAFPWRQ